MEDKEKNDLHHYNWYISSGLTDKVPWGAIWRCAIEVERIRGSETLTNATKRLSRFGISPNWDGRKDPRVLKDLPKASCRKEAERKASERRTAICKWDYKRRAEKTRNANEKRDERAEEMNEWTNESPPALGNGRNELLKSNVQWVEIQIYFIDETTRKSERRKSRENYFKLLYCRKFGSCFFSFSGDPSLRPFVLGPSSYYIIFKEK